VREPARRDAAAPGAARLSLRELAAALLTPLRSRGEIALALLGGSMLVYGSASALLVVTWLVEERGYAFARAAFLAGVVAVFAGFLGNLAGGAFGDRCAKRRPNGHLWSLIPMTLFFVPAALGFYLSEAGSALFFLCWFLSAAGNSAYFGPLFASVQELAPARSRSTVIAFGLLAVNLLGTGPGPLVTGWIGDEKSLSLGLVASQGVVLLAIVPFALALRRRPAA
jgi:MFS family permease